MRKRTVYSLLCVFFAIVFMCSTGVTLATWIVEDNTTNIISISGVKGKVVEVYEQGQVVYPNGQVRKVVQVENTGSIDAVVRVKVEKTWGDSRDENGKLIINTDLNTDNIQITYNTENWYFNEEDGYFYYKGYLEPNEITPSLFDKFVIDGETTGGAYKGKHADIIVNMEMVQIGGEGLSYWNVTAEELEISYNQRGQVQTTTTVEFLNPDDKFSFKVNNGDLFANFKNIVPGESRSQLVSITNNWDKEEVEILLWADYIDQTQATDENRDLINKLLREYTTIVITDNKGEVIYRGPVWGNLDVDSYGIDSMKYPFSLGDFDYKETKELNINLYLDQEVDNDYRDLLGKIKWVFSAEGVSSQEPPDRPPIDEPSITDPPVTDPPVTDPPTTVDPPVTTDPPVVKPPQTGAEIKWMNITLMAISAVGFVVIILLGRKKEDNEDNDS
ncbi:MAG: hypothetical protein GX896_06750 [Clostridiales bacterium]|nr:hypothetical protein [Clostridiales bacterium]